MSITNRTAEIPVSHSEDEVAFGFSELFFSRTDERGKIQSGNTVFQRVSGYSWQELLNKPHNVIRHSDMPRGVFWLLWDRIRRGLPTGAYVKNRSQDGRYYWVYAIVTPVEGGYLSVRLKPSSPVFCDVQAVYAEILACEAKEGLSPSQSATRLNERLIDAGCRDYDNFMAMSLLAEFQHRSLILCQGIPAAITSFNDLMTSANKLLSTAEAIADACNAYRFVPLNLIVQAGQMGSAGAAIGTISANYSMLSQEIQVNLATFFEAARRVSMTIHEGAFFLATSMVQEEVSVVFENEPVTQNVDHLSEATKLRHQLTRYQAKAAENLRGIQRELKQFGEGTAGMKRLASGLAAIRVMGKVEAGRLGTTVLNDLICDLEAFQEKLNQGLNDIANLNNGLCFNADQLEKLHASSEVGLRLDPSCDAAKV